MKKVNVNGDEKFIVESSNKIIPSFLKQGLHKRYVKSGKKVKKGFNYSSDNNEQIFGGGISRERYVVDKLY